MRIAPFRYHNRPPRSVAGILKPAREPALRLLGIHGALLVGPSARVRRMTGAAPDREFGPLCPRYQTPSGEEQQS